MSDPLFQGLFSDTLALRWFSFCKTEFRLGWIQLNYENKCCDLLSIVLDHLPPTPSPTPYLDNYLKLESWFTCSHLIICNTWRGKYIVISVNSVCRDHLCRWNIEATLVRMYSWNILIQKGKNAETKCLHSDLKFQ